MNNIENNKLIASFMGWTPSKTNPDYLILRPEDDKPAFEHPLKMFNPGSNYYIDHPKTGCRPNSLMYDKSWDWLMPVIEKIENIDNGSCVIFVEIINSSCCISHMINHNWPNDKAIISEYNLSNSKSKLEAVYNAIVDFITWYNNEDL